MGGLSPTVSPPSRLTPSLAASKFNLCGRTRFSNFSFAFDLSVADEVCVRLIDVEILLSVLLKVSLSVFDDGCRVPSSLRDWGDFTSDDV